MIGRGCGGVHVLPFAFACSAVDGDGPVVVGLGGGVGYGWSFRAGSGGHKAEGGEEGYERQTVGETRSHGDHLKLA